MEALQQIEVAKLYMGTVSRCGGLDVCMAGLHFQLHVAGA